MGKNIFLNALLFLPVAFLAVFFFFPAALVFLKASSAQDFFGTLFSSQKLFAQSFLQASLSTVAAFLIGFPAAYVFSKHEFFGKKFLLAASILPFVFPSILVALSFVILLGNNGILNVFLMNAFGQSEPPLRILYGLSGIVLAHAFYNFGIFLRIVHNAWNRTGEKMENAARTLGAGSFQVFWRITLPRLLPPIIAAAMIVFVYSFMSFAVVLTLGGASFATVETGIFFEISRKLDFASAAVLSLAQFFFLSLSLLVLDFFRKKTATKEETFLSQKPRLSLGSSKGIVLHAFIGLLFLIVVLPVIAIALFSISTREGISFEAFSEILFSGKKSLAGTTPMTSIFYSLAFAAAGGMISVCLGFLLSIYLLEKKSRWVLVAGVSPIAVSAITLSLGYILAFGSGQALFIAAAYAVISFPFAFKIISEAVEKTPEETFFAARSLGAGKMQVIRKIVFPSAKPALIVAFAFSFAVSISELGLTMLLSEGKFPTMAVYIQRLVSTYNIAGAAAMGMILIFFSGLSFYLIEKTQSGASVV